MATYKAVILQGNLDTKNDGTTNIKIRITHLRNVNYISTDLFVIPQQMDRKQGVVKSGPNKDFINMSITNWLQRLRKADIELGDQRNYMTVTELKKSLLNGKSSSQQIDFFEFIKEYNSTVNVWNTANNFNALASSLKSFVGNYLPVSEINFAFLKNYENYLRSRGVKNGITNYMVNFRSLFNKVRNHYNDEDSGILLIPNYPFRKYKIPRPKVKSNEHVLTIEELQTLINYKHTNPGEEFAKDMFLLMFYLIGIEAKDLFYLNLPKKGRVFYDRYKTGRLYSLKLEPEAKKIIGKYRGDKYLLNVSNRFVLNTSFFRTINNYLHGDPSHNIVGIMQQLGINKQVTSKWAKHTWATIARNECRINKDDVALCLGHEDSDNRVTDIYVKYDYSIIDESNRKVIDFVNSHCTSLDVPLNNK